MFVRERGRGEREGWRERERERGRMALDMKYGGFILNDVFE